MDHWYDPVMGIPIFLSGRAMALPVGYTKENAFELNEAYVKLLKCCKKNDHEELTVTDFYCKFMWTKNQHE